MSDYDIRRWEEAAERAERDRRAERQSRREMRYFTFWGLLVFGSFMFLVLLGVRGCANNAERQHELEMSCIAHGGTWQGGSWGDGDTQDGPTCTQKTEK